MKSAKRRERIGLPVAKWGNSLAVRLPADAAKRLGVEEGDTLAAEIASDGRLVLTPEARALGKQAVRRLRDFVSGQNETKPVVAAMRRAARY